MHVPPHAQQTRADILSEGGEARPHAVIPSGAPSGAQPKASPVKFSPQCCVSAWPALRPRAVSPGRVLLVDLGPSGNATLRGKFHSREASGCRAGIFRLACARSGRGASARRRSAISATSFSHRRQTETDVRPAIPSRGAHPVLRRHPPRRQPEASLPPPRRSFALPAVAPPRMAEPGFRSPRAATGELAPLSARKHASGLVSVFFGRQYGRASDQFALESCQTGRSFIGWTAAFETPRFCAYAQIGGDATA